MGKIVQLSTNVINQIAAGEVIERPYSVVKELVENSIDAGATKISIEVSNECRNLRIADNGSGIEEDDIVLAFTKHATSKIKSENDLYNISTMGFRGEALASIISISKLTCITRTKDSETGIKVECENSEVKQSKTGCAIGTIMEIKELFYNIPARLKFLKSEKTEFAYINELVQSLAIINSNISFELKNNGKLILKTTGQGNLPLVMKEVFSENTDKNFCEVNYSDKLSGLYISGYVSTPDYTRASKKDYYTYVNSRIVKCPVFNKSIDMVYKNLTASTRYPFIVLNLQIPSEDVDVNVHPTKKEVRYKNSNQIFNFIFTAINNSLTAKNRDNSGNNYINNENKYNNDFSGDNTKEDSIFVEQGATLADIFKNSDSGTQNVVPLPRVSYANTANSTQKQQSIMLNQKQIINENSFTQEENIIGQYKKTYILIERDEGLEIVDQHIAEERYIYEQLKKTKNIDCQLLFISDVIQISSADKALLETNTDKLQKFGYEVDFISENELIFRKVPQILSKIPPKEILADILEHISGDIDNIEEQILITTSCKAAVKANTYLNQFQMQEIIKNWRSCEKPFTCPHGRPISKIIEHKDIAKFFQRNK